MGRINNNSVSTTYVVPCGTWPSYHTWWWDVYSKLTCNLSSGHATSKTATPLGQTRKVVGCCLTFCAERKKGSSAGCTWRKYVHHVHGRLFAHCIFWSLDLLRFLPLGVFTYVTPVFIPVPFVLPPPFQCMFDVVLPITKAPFIVHLSGMHCYGLEKEFLGSSVVIQPRLAPL